MIKINKPNLETIEMINGLIELLKRKDIEYAVTIRTDRCSVRINEISNFKNDFEVKPPLVWVDDEKEIFTLNMYDYGVVSFPITDEINIEYQDKLTTICLEDGTKILIEEC